MKKEKKTTASSVQELKRLRRRVAQLELVESEHKRAETTQRVLHQIANAVHTTKDLNELFNTIRQDLSVILNTENFFIALYDRKSDTFTLPYIEDEKDTFDTFPAGKTLTAYVVKHDKPLLATDKDMHRLTQSGVVETIGASSKIWLGVPLKAEKEIIGTLVVQSYTDETAYLRRRCGKREIKRRGISMSPVQYL
jgi:transcriptional regulator with GAF, ATPase, and Fis domain